MAKFKVVKVQSFRYKDKRYAKGEIVEISGEDAKRFAGLDFLDPIKEELPKELEKPEKPRKKG